MRRWLARLAVPASVLAMAMGVTAPDASADYKWRHWDVYTYNGSNQLVAHGWADIEWTSASNAKISNMGIKDNRADGHPAKLYVIGYGGGGKILSTEGHKSPYIARYPDVWDLRPYYGSGEIELMATAGSAHHSVYVLRY